MDELQERIQKDHQEAEILRLRAGYDGCGCADCQEFYKTLDLSVYKDRVLTMAGVTCIVAGRAGADKWKEYHQNEDNNRATARHETLRNGVDNVTKIKDGESPLSNMPDNFVTTEKRGKGRPKKAGEVSRMTAWRRQKEQQAEMFTAPVPVGSK